MELIKNKTNFDFIGYRYLFICLSLALIAMSGYLWFSPGDEKFGVDFRGGMELVVRFNEPTSAGEVREAFEKGGVKDPIVQAFEKTDKDFSLRLDQSQATEAGKKQVKDILQALKPSGYTLLKEDYVGPVVGEQIRKDAYYAIIFSLIAMLVYVAFRFEWRFGLGGIIALFHDVIIATGFCLLTGRPFSAGILAALLTIVGYSINDTIIVYDRIRENMVKALKTSSKKKPQGSGTDELASIMNTSINETLSRTILTSLTAFFVCTTLWAFGGGAVSDLAFALMVGVVVGTYSSIFIACPVVMAFEKK